MLISKIIKERIGKSKPGTTFKYKDLGIEPGDYSAAAKAIERLIEDGTIKRITTGLFYVPKVTAFGILKPSEDEMLKPYLFENKKRVAYITGNSIFNKYGLTTQVPTTVKIASRNRVINLNLGTIRVRSVKSYVDVTDKNYYLLELLDIIKDFKIIQDNKKQQSIALILNRLVALTDAEKKQLISYALNYPPRVIAFLGLLLENQVEDNYLKKLKNKLNPFTTFDFGLSKEKYPQAKNWNLK